MSEDLRCAQARQELGAYLLGMIGPAQRSAVGHHLAVCPACRGELAGLAGLPGLLRRVSVQDARQLLEDETSPTPGPPLNTLLDRVARARRRRRYRSAAGTLVAVVAAVVGWQALHQGHPPGPAAPQWTMAAEAASARTSAHADVRYLAEPGGTEIEVRVTGVAVGSECQFRVIGPHGQQAAAGGWVVTLSQLGAWHPASVSFPAAGLRSFQVLADGQVLVTVPAR